MNNKERNKIRADFVNACENGMFNVVKEYIKTYLQEIDQDVINNGLECACDNNQLEIVKFLLTSKDIPIHAQINHIEYTGMGSACLAEAVRSGHIEVLDYLLTSPELKEHADLSLDNYYVFEEIAARIGKKTQMKTVCYLTQFMDFSERTEPYNVIVKLLKDERLNPLIMQHLIMEKDFAETDEIKEIVESLKKKEYKSHDYNIITEAFALKKLNKSLKKDLNIKNQNQNQNKKNRVKI